MKYISPSAIGIGKSQVGEFTIIRDNTIFAKGVQIGTHCLIEEGVEIGENTVIRNYVELRKGTKIGANCYIDSRVSTSGDCTIGDNVTIRFASIICREAVVEDNVFIAPQVMTQYSKANMDKVPGIVIGEGSFIGTQAVLGPGVKVGKGCIIGTQTYLTKEAFRNNKYYQPQDHVRRILK